MSVCRSCQAPIRWVRHLATGNPMPIDPEPTPDGNVHLVGGNHFKILGVGDVEPGPKYVSHFVTCPDARVHRR